MTSPKRVLPPPGVIDKYPVLPLRDIVVFPHMIVPLFVGREKSIRALEEVMKADKFIMLATQKNAAEDDPKPDAVYGSGVLASVLQLLKLPDGTVKVLVEGVTRAKVAQYVRTEEYYEAEVEVTPEEEADPVEAEALARSVASEFEGYVKLNKKVSPEVVSAVAQIDDASKLADTVASHLSVKITDRQAVLEMTSVTKRLEKCLALMESEISVLQVEKRIRTRVKRQMEKTQREYYLNEQMKAIQKELGDEDGKDDLAELEERIKNTKLSKEARDKATGELKKLRHNPNTDQLIIVPTVPMQNDLYVFALGALDGANPNGSPNPNEPLVDSEGGPFYASFLLKANAPILVPVTQVVAASVPQISAESVNVAASMVV
ncbi:LON peptidase substrate-binding domain-containing protein, partial [Rhodoblastus sp.]|uniref:LON peptidase substrate-binding domain-containing protein n=1 Tax=Rhodoblastus sp. TaxID=1962975 RepID=UPI003F969F60